MEFLSTPLKIRELLYPSILPSCRLLWVYTAIFIYLILSLTTAISLDETLYSAHCGEFLRAPPLIPIPNPPIVFQRVISLRRAHVAFSANDTNKDVSVVPKSLSFSSNRAYKTQKDDVFKIEGLLNLKSVPRRQLRLVNVRSPRIPMTSGNPWSSYRVSLSGFWDSISGKLCMVDSGFGRFGSNNYVLKLDYSNSSSIFNSLVNGTLENFDGGNGGASYPKLISILGVNLRNYKFELIDKEIESNGFRLLDDMANVSLPVVDSGRNLCTYIRSAGTVELEYMNDCNSVNCNFLGGKGQSMPRVMYFNEIECSEDGRVRYLLGFGNLERNGHNLPFEPNVTLITEGKWDGGERRLDMVGCRIFSDSDDFVGECLIRLSFRFPDTWTLRYRSTLVGELWSSRNFNESGYFGKVLLASGKNMNLRFSGLKYNYTEIENASRFCENKPTQKVKGKYPNPLSSDMRFDMSASNKKVKDLWGYSSPLYVENKPFHLSNVFGWEGESAKQWKQNLSNVINVSYVLSLSSSQAFKLNNEFLHIDSFDISAEGIYNSKTGHLCMIGCLHVPLAKVGVSQNSSLDCEVLVDIKYPPSRSEGKVKGTIESMRKKFDNLYFEPFEIVSSSIYAGQAKESIWRMDLEITMVLISNTLSCIFIGLQLLHVKRHPGVLPLISIIMLVLLTLAHMIPLLLNFEALFKVGHNRNVYFANDGWLEVNEVLVRVITMIAFLLEFLLLRKAWSSRSGDGNQKNFWTSDKKVIFLSLPIYIGGGLIAWLVHQSRKPYHSPSSLKFHRFGYKKQSSLWGEFKSYAGLILDGFLLPQILFNMFGNTKEKALAPSFYVGTTLVRLLPHAYDLYRSYGFPWSFEYIYANPRMDYYSTTWDIVISVGGMVFVSLIYLQQRFGGRCLIPKKFMSSYNYEKVPVVNIEQP